MIKHNTRNSPDELFRAMEDADVWMLVTVKADKTAKEGGAAISVRESYSTGSIDMIAMLLEQKEIFNAVQAKIAQVKMMDGKKGKKSPNLNVN